VTAAALVMAKAPLPGRVKTRLEPVFTPAECARVQELLIDRTARWALEIAPGAAYLAYDPPDARAATEPLVPPGVSLLPQRGDHLGERIAAASGEVMERHPGAPLLVVGVDTRLSPGHAEAALEWLDGGADVVFGPALDGGYYLVALGRAAPALFAIDETAWGGPGVLESSVAAARAAGLDVALLDSARDLDTPEDAAEMLSDPELGELLRSVLRRARP
jgi:rSAM/selenodomain-associated transferase 1